MADPGERRHGRERRFLLSRVFRYVHGHGVRPNGSFEYGRFGWRGSYESNSRIEWMLDHTNSSHGRWSMRSAPAGRLTLISKPIRLALGRSYRLSADLRADAPGRRASLGIVSTYLPKRTSIKRRNKGFTVGPEWKRVSLKIPDPARLHSGFVYIAIGKSEGTLWVDHVRIEPGGPVEEREFPADAFGVRFLTHRLGDTFFCDTGLQPVDAFLVNGYPGPRTLHALSRTFDFFGEKVDEKDYGSVSLGAFGEKSLDFQVDLRRRGPFRVDFEIRDPGTKQTRTMTYRYNVIRPLKGIANADSSPFGMNTHMEREPNAHLSCNLEMLSQCGVKWIRAWWGWGMAEKRPAQFDWTEYERQFRLVDEKKMRIMPILLRYYPQYEQAWAGLVDKIQRPPYKLDQWGSFVHQTVFHFRSRVAFWEIWNEPGYSKGFAPEFYADLCKITYRQAGQADPKCRLVGFAGVPLDFMEKAAEAGAFEAMDIISEHTYGQLAHPETAMPERMKKVQALLKSHDRVLPVWHTEQGMGGDGDGYVAGLLSEEECASALVRGYLSALAAGAKKFFWFSAQTSPTYGWAIFYEDYVPRPRLVALNGMASLIEGAVFRQRIDLGDNVVACVFEKGKDSIAAVWNIRRPVDIQISSSPGPVGLFNLMGERVRRAPIGVPARASLRRRFPVYLRFLKTSVERVAAAIRAAELTERPWWQIQIARSRRSLVKVHLKSMAAKPLDALVVISCHPPLKFDPPSQFALDIQPGENRRLEFRYEPSPETRTRVFTVTAHAGPFRLRETSTRTTLEL